MEYLLEHSIFWVSDELFTVTGPYEYDQINYDFVFQSFLHEKKLWNKDYGRMCIRNNPTDGAMGEIKKSRNWEKPRRRALTIEEQTAFVNFLKESETYAHWKNTSAPAAGTADP